ncbi:MAG: CBS domain-containing protein [Anaerolineaceae bacterium]|nr:CBS domain-containing protein [Anaerolineaceae bacterium]
MSQDEAPQGFKITDKQAENITRVEELAYELRVDEVMTGDVKSLDPDMPMADALDLFRTARISGAPVTVNNLVVGVISLEDLIRWLNSGSMESTVEEYMSTTLVTVHCTDPVVEALKLFVNSRHGRLPVLDEKDRLVGILTKGDITLGLLQALQRDYHVEELRTYRASHLFEDIISDRTSLMLRYTIQQGDFNRGGTASSYIKRALLRMGASPQIARRCGIAAYEAEMNLIIHTINGGVMRVEIEPHQITLEAYDDGPGIKNINLAMRPGYSTATEEIRELGFGAGMGLVNIQRCVDSMNLESTYGKGTRLRMKLFLQKPEEQPE